MCSQGTRHLKSNPKFLSFVGETLGSKVEAPWLPSIQIEVEKPFGRHNPRLR